MIANASLIALMVFGFKHLPVWWIIPLIILNNFIGMHTPPERMQYLKEMGASYWGFFFTNLPLMTIFGIVLYGAGYGIGLFFT